jgi:hypothetical protein
VILGPPDRPPGSSLAGDATLDDLFGRAAERHPDHIALVDPPDRESFTDGAPRSLTYAQADRAISAIAAALRASNLHPDAVVALQLANTVESVLAFLAVLRAGLIAMPLPLLWRRAEVVSALRRGGVSALIVSGRIGSTNHFDLAINAAAEVFTVRHVFGFGRDPPDGMIALDDPSPAAGLGPAPANAPATSPGRSAHLAVVTWDVSAQGAIAVARSHAELIAGGLAVLLEGRFAQNATILTTLPAGSFGGLATSLLPWLLTGGTLALHHAFDAEVFAAQCRDLDCSIVVVPGAAAALLSEAGHFSREGLEHVVALWRAPERLRAASWQARKAALLDVQVFGEVGLIAAPRQPNGRPAAAFPLGAICAPRGIEGAVEVAQAARTAAGTLALRGSMVPAAPFPPGSERGPLPFLRVLPDGFIDTGYICRAGIGDTTIEVSGSPAGTVSCGGYRFAVRELTATISRLDPSGTLIALPDALAGQRLGGSAADREAIGMALRGIGANPLLVAAFQDDRRRMTDDRGQTEG